MPEAIKSRTEQEYNEWDKTWKIDGDKMMKIKEAQKKETSNLIKVEKFKDNLSELKDRGERNKDNKEYEW